MFKYFAILLILLTGCMVKTEPTPVPTATAVPIDEKELFMYATFFGCVSSGLKSLNELPEWEYMPEEQQSFFFSQLTSHCVEMIDTIQKNFDEDLLNERPEFWKDIYTPDAQGYLRG